MKYRIEKVEYEGRVWYEIKRIGLFLTAYLVLENMEHVGRRYKRLGFDSVEDAKEFLKSSNEQRTTVCELRTKELSK